MLPLLCETLPAPRSSASSASALSLVCSRWQFRPRVLSLIGFSETIDHTPRAHPASPTGTLPDSFAAYRAKAQQHGPLGRASFTQGSVGRSPGASLGPIQPKQGEFFDRTDLPNRFHRLPYTEAEIEAIETGGASLFA
jgi:small subunit ribosomal protein YMR-31